MQALFLVPAYPLTAYSPFFQGLRRDGEEDDIVEELEAVFKCFEEREKVCIPNPEGSALLFLLSLSLSHFTHNSNSAKAQALQPLYPLL